MTLQNKRNKARILRNNEYKDHKGMTIVALVVTIILLLILAAVTISMIFSPNGLYDRAMQAKEATRDRARKRTNKISS